MEHDEDNHFFSVSGVAFLSIDEITEPADQIKQAPVNSLDAIEAALAQLGSKLSLVQSDLKWVFEDTLSIVREFYQATKITIESKVPYLLTQFKATKHDIHISAKNLNFKSTHSYPINKEKRITIVMADYPHATLSVTGIITRCTEKDGLFDIMVFFKDLSQQHEDTLVQFVNSLQRKEISKKREQIKME